jgi:hypothetical protein
MKDVRTRSKPLGGLLAALLILTLAAPAAAGETAEWHRLNPGGSQGSSEHERLTCREGAESWTCVYDKLADPGYAWDGTVGHIAGRDVTSSWTCPEWFPPQACAGVVQVVRGNALYLVDGGRPFPAGHELIVTSNSGTEVLYVHWIDQFVCPWYRTFDEATAANPEFDGDCTFA